MTVEEEIALLILDEIFTAADKKVQLTLQQQNVLSEQRQRLKKQPIRSFYALKPSFDEMKRDYATYVIPAEVFNRYKELLPPSLRFFKESIPDSLMFRGVFVVSDAQ